jgi:hypothetical protein
MTGIQPNYLLYQLGALVLEFNEMISDDFVKFQSQFLKIPQNNSFSIIFADHSSSIWVQFRDL